MRELIRTKTFWGGVGTIGYGIYLFLSGNPQEGIQNILIGLSVIFLRDAVRKS